MSKADWHGGQRGEDEVLTLRDYVALSSQPTMVTDSHAVRICNIVCVAIVMLRIKQSAHIRNSKAARESRAEPCFSATEFKLIAQETN